MFKRLLFFSFFIFSHNSFAEYCLDSNNNCLPASEAMSNIGWWTDILPHQTDGNCGLLWSGGVAGYTSVCTPAPQNDDCPAGDLSGSTTDGSCDCPNGGYYSNVTQQCEEYQDDDCPDGDLSGDPRDGECKECPTGEWKNPETQQCERQCPFPLEWSLKYGQCVEKDVCEKGDYSGDPTDRKCGCEPPKVNFLELCLDECTGGTIRNPTTGICQENCPAGYSSVTLNGVTACFQEGERGGCNEGSSAGLLNGVVIHADSNAI